MLAALGTVAVFQLAGGAIDVDPVEHGRVVADGGDETEDVRMEDRVRIRDVEAFKGEGGGRCSGNWSGLSLREDPELWS